jgi:predicted ATPase
MRFSRIVLENWRNFKRVDVPLQSRAFLVGPNASGKSNFLDAFRFLHDVASSGGGFRKSTQDRGGMSHLRHLFSRGKPDILVEVSLADREKLKWRYRIVFGDNEDRLPILKEEKVWKADELILDRPNQEDRADKERLGQTYLEQTSANREFRAIAEFFDSVRYYHIVPQLVRDQGRWRLARQAGDPYGSDFLEQLGSMNERKRDERLSRIADTLKLAVPQLEDLKFGKDQRGEPHLYAKYGNGSSGVGRQAETDFSDGTLRLIGLLWGLLDGRGPLLLEEPELSLHPGIVRYIPQMMWRVQRGSGEDDVRQVLLSTHSSDLLRDEGIAADEVVLLTPRNGESVVQVGADIQEVKQLLEAGLTAADVVIPRTEPKTASHLPFFGD